MITIKVKIYEEKNYVYILDNTHFEDEKGNIISHGGLKELNESNVQLFINEQQYKKK